MIVLSVAENAAESPLLSVVKEVSTTSADSSFDMMSSVIPGYQPPSRRLTTPVSPMCPGHKTPELFTPSSKSLMMINAAAAVIHSDSLFYTTVLSARYVLRPLVCLSVYHKTPELFTPSSKSLMINAAAAVIHCDLYQSSVSMVCTTAPCLSVCLFITRHPSCSLSAQMSPSYCDRGRS